MAVSAADLEINFRSQGADRVVGDLRRVDSAVDQTGQKSQSMFRTMAATAGGFIAANVLGRVASGFTDVVTSGMDFEAQMSAIQAVTNATAAEMDGMTETALRLGQETSFSATEAAMAVEELAKAGVPVQDILDGAA